MTEHESVEQGFSRVSERQMAQNGAEWQLAAKIRR